MKNKKRIVLFAAVLLLAALLFAGCAAVKEDISYLAAKLEGEGESVKYYEAGDSMLTVLDGDMKKVMEDPPEGSLAGYLFAEETLTGTMTCEVFLFENEDDAKKLFDYFKDGDSFEKGISEVRRSGKVVYMGLVAELDLLEE